MTSAAPLAGVRVIDFSRVLSGPIVGRLLCDLGADVIKVEPPEGDLTRFAYPKVDSMSLYYAQQNCGKRNVSIDLDEPEGRSIAAALCAGADVVLENFRPGVMQRFGLDYDTVAAGNPRVVYASISGYGQTGVWADRRAYAVVVHAEGGLLDAGARMRARATESPSALVQDGMSHADVYAGFAAATAINAALFARERTGVGDHIDVAMAEAMVFVQDFAHWDYAPADAVARDDQWPALAPAYSPIVKTRDGRDVVIAGDPVATGVFELYATAIGKPDLRNDERFATLPARRALRAELLGIVHAWTASLDATELERALSRVGLANGEVRSVADLLHTEWAHQRGVLVAAPGRGTTTIPVIQSPFRFTRADVGTRGAPAFRGEHNHEVLETVLGYDAALIQQLEECGVLSSRPPSPHSSR